MDRFWGNFDCGCIVVCTALGTNSTLASIKVPEGDGCKRLDPPADIEGEALPRVVAHRHRSTAERDDAHRFTLMQKFFDRLTVLKLYADLISIDFTLVIAFNCLDLVLPDNFDAAQPDKDRLYMLDKMNDWDIMEIIKECHEQGTRFFIVNWNWPERLEKTANVCMESHRFGPLKELQLEWNRAKSIVMSIVRGERSPRTESERIVEAQGKKLQNYLKFVPKSVSKGDQQHTPHADRPAISSIAKFEVMRCQSLDSGAEHARSMRTRAMHSQFIGRNVQDMEGAHF